jgi:hypothetical protein
MKRILSAAAMAVGVLALAGTSAFGAVLCNGKDYCWRSNEYPPGARIQVRPDWRQSYLRPNYWDKDVFVTGPVGGGAGGGGG